MCEARTHGACFVPIRDRPGDIGRSAHHNLRLSRMIHQMSSTSAAMSAR
jgi:hypothetical protein